MLVKPKILSIITTHRCTAACDHCCFNCTPKTLDSIPTGRLHSLIDEARALPSIRMIVFTGGECFLLGEVLFDLIAHCKRNGYRTRCVTNGYWATARNVEHVTAKLKSAGLDEINFSTGEEHGSYVPTERVRLGALACSRQGIGTLINIETFRNTTFDLQGLVGEPELSKAIASGQVSIKHSVWIEGEGARELQHLAAHSRFREANMGGCHTAMTVLAVTPRQSLVACCGLHLERIPELHIGSVAHQTLAEAINGAPDDFLKIWLHVEGPERILRFVKDKLPGYELPVSSVHPCTTCLHLYKDDQARAIIAQHYGEVEQRVCKVFLAGVAGGEARRAGSEVAYGDQ